MIHAINNIANVWWGWMAAMFWQVSLLILFIACLDTLIKRWAWPQLRYALWLLVLIKLVLPPGISMPGSLTERLQPRFERIISRTINEPSTITPYSPWIVAAESSVTPEALVSSPQVTFERQFSKPDAASAAMTPESPAVRLMWQSYAFIIWLCGMTSLGYWLISRLYRLRTCQSRSGSSDAMPQSFHHMLAQCVRRLKLRRVPRIVVTGKVVCPAVFGIFRPVLLMPKGYLSKLSRKDTEHMLLHELAHIKRGDPIVHSLYLVLQIVYWFNPLLWLARRQLIHLRELCCDATVARILKDKTNEYRETLIDIARRFLTRPVEPSLGLLGLFEDTNRLLVRLSWLEKKTWRYQKMKNLFVITIVTLMLAFVLPMAKAQETTSTENPMTHSEHTEESMSHEVSDQETEVELTEDQEKLSEELAALEIELEQLQDKDKFLQEMQALRTQLEKLEIEKQNLRKELATLEKSRLTVDKAREQATQATKIAIAAKDKAVKASKDAKKWKQWAEQWTNSESFKQWHKDIEKWSQQIHQLHPDGDRHTWDIDPESEEFKQWHQQIQQWNERLHKWQNSDEFKHWHEQMQHWQEQMQHWQQQMEHQVPEHEMDSEVHEHPVQAPVPPPAPQLPALPPMPSMPSLPSLPPMPEMPPLPPMPADANASADADASADVELDGPEPVVVVTPTSVPSVVEVPKVSSPAVEVPISVTSPVVTPPSAVLPSQPGQSGINVKKDHDSKFVATREMEFVAKIQTGTPLVVENKIGKIVLNPSKDRNCTVKAIIRATAETAEKAQEMIEQVAMNNQSSKERFYIKPVKSGDDKWNNLNVDLHITVPSGVAVDISTDVGSIEIANLKERIKGVTNVGSIKAVNIIGEIQLTTKVGDIEFVPHKDLSAKLEAKTKVGSITSDLLLEINKVDIVASKATGTIGSGEKNIRLTTEVGKIRIKKHSSAEK